MFMQDVRYAVRSLLKNPGFTAIAVACLSLGIGVNSTIFSVVDGVILRPYPYPDADQIVVLEDGEVVGIGTHDQLLETNSTYAEIVESQLTVGVAT